MCPVGFEITPENPADAYQRDSNPRESELRIIVSDISKMYSMFHCITWDDVATDILC